MILPNWHIRIGGMESRNKRMNAGTYTRQELISIVEGKIEITQFDDEEPRVIKTNKLEGISEVVFSLDEIDNTNNLSDGLPSNTLLKYHVTAYDNSTHFESYTPKYNKLKNGEFVSLTLRIKHMKNNIVTDGPATTVVLHIR